MAEKESLASKLSRVMELVPYVRKSLAPAGVPFKSYLSEAGLLHAVRQAMVDNGILMYPSGVSNWQVERYTTTGDREKHWEFISGIYSFVVTDGAEQITVSVASQARSDSGKAAAVAQTMALKYAIRQLLLIETGDKDELLVEIENAIRDAESVADLEGIDIESFRGDVSIYGNLKRDLDNARRRCTLAGLMAGIDFDRMSSTEISAIGNKMVEKITDKSIAESLRHAMHSKASQAKIKELSGTKPKE